MATLPDDTLLCESCGYVLEGLSAEARCPECGTAMEWSLPARRVGTPWQKRRDLRGWLRTTWLMCRRPRGQFETMSTESADRWTLLWSYLLIAGLFLVAPWAGMGAIRASFPPRGPHAIQETLLYVAGSLLNLGVALGALWLLTWIEVVGIRFFAARRGWRLSQSAAWQIAAHSAVGWTLCGILPLIGLANLTVIDRFAPSLWNHSLDLTWAAMGMVSVRSIATVILVLGGYVAGMLVFESLVYVGVLRCRFANAPRAGMTESTL